MSRVRGSRTADADPASVRSRGEPGMNRRARHWPWIAAFAVAYGALALLVENEYRQLIMTVVLVWAVMGLAWNLLSGYSGLISFGHAAFFGLGAYFVALLQLSWGVSPWLGIPLASLLGGIAGVVVGVPTFRLRGHYFALAMLAYPLALLYVFEWLGYQEVAVPMVRDAPAAYMQFADGRAYIFIGLGFVLAAMFVTRLVERSRFGMCLLAIKQDETAAEAAGIDTLAWKLRAIVLSGAMAATIGGFYAVVQLVVTPLSVFGMLVSAQALIVAMFGGVGTVWGPVIGAVTLVPLSAWLDAEFAERLPGIQGVIYGIAIVAVVMLAPEGLFWKVRDILGRRRAASGRAASGVAAESVRASGSGASAQSAPSGVASDRATARSGVASNSVSSDAPSGVASDPATASAPPAAARTERFRVAAARAGRTVLAVNGLSKSFGGLRAVDAVSLEVRQGEIVGIIGPNGAGKTTLFNLLNGFIAPDAGEVLLDGRNIVGKAPNRICRGGVGRTFQIVKPFRRMSIADNVAIGAYVRAGSDQEATALALDAIAAVGLGDAAESIAGSLSNEQLRLMELARALASRPSILLLDEIFAGLAHAEVERLMQVIRGLARLGITIVIIEHTMQAMVQLVDRFIVLDHGAVLAAGSPETVTRDPAVIEAYLGRKWLENA